MRRRTRRTAGVIAAAALLIVTSIVFRGSTARALAVAQRPLVSAGTWITDRTFGWFGSNDTLLKRTAELEKQRLSAAVDRVELERLRAENAELRAQLSFANRARVRTVLSSVVSRSVGPEASAFVIDRGSSDGIDVGDPAVSEDGVLVGKVVAVSAGSATVRAVTDRNSAVAVALLNGARTIGIARGISGALMSLSYIPQDERVSSNDIVVTSGLETRVPSGLIVGIVNTVTGNSTDPFQEAVVEPLGDVRRIHTVSIIVSEGL
jgi:rod shape-determining protein MreC